ncbi:hypothetical protein N5P37_000641 [Trichoderma harzianum]|uniref:Uncharacterized protein n=1 Tax=Trichoderma harzianum CBS 226.95 TaxID=983964 RepID=A0A2T4AIF2_TRIHA|nr:hypothetical protein M431DRAFT_81902 [Trichoderma harzianum CBS 226.95]KAK0766911.1 hypothetical protein N5P37_000641 [Trichoderma harzianum]PKK54359.1 hypothetical protein CI102_706 [Trichoderma harzianum]PTB56827.1 hypothetical protein M431DRAFT_81902 [Trichoderma harzianum CBS 226.95]
MPKAESSSDASDQEDITDMLETGGELYIARFFISSQDSRSLRLDVEGTLCAGFDIGWVSTVRVRLYYRNILVGEITSPDTQMIPDSDNYVITKWRIDEEPIMHIKSMVGFKNFFCDIMPKENANNELDVRKQATAALRVSPSGHRLTMSINLANMPRMTTTIKRIRIFGEKIKITMILTNPSPVTLHAEVDSEFVLKKGEDTVGHLAALFEIIPGENECVLAGNISPNVSGMVTLKGSSYEDSDESWQQYVITLFEININMDEAVVCVEADESEDE